MINICGSNLIPIFITFLCCGAIFIYFNLRLNEIKFAVEKQNRVLTAFITNVQQDIRSSGENLAAPEAVAAAKKFVLERESENEKIVVSDDEEEDETDSDDSISDSDESDEDDDCEEPRDETKNIKFGNLEQMVPIAFEVLSVNATSALPDMSSSIIEIMDEPFNLVNLLSTVTDSTVTDSTVSETTVTDSTITDSTITDSTVSDATKPESYEQMRVDDLRKIVSDKNLASKEDVKKLKKPELLVLLKK
jgi:hypothetical protein